MRRSAGLAIAGIMLLWALPALAQSTPVYQKGTGKAGDLAKFFTNGLVGSAATNGVLGDAQGKGINPFAVTDSGTKGLCFNSGPTSGGGGYSALCIGHDGSGNGIITLDSFGQGAGDLLIQKNGTTYSFPGGGAGAGNVQGPNSSTQNDLALFNNGSGTLLRGSGMAVFDPSAQVSLNGFAPILLTPSVGNTSGSGGTDRTVGIMLRPTISGNFNSNNDFMAALNLKWGELPSQGSAIAPGTKGNFAGYEANISTSQVASDVTEGPHLFGGTMYTNAGAPSTGLALAMNVVTTAPGGGGTAIIRGSIDNEIGNGTGGTYGAVLQGNGSVNSGTAVWTFGNWVTGIDLYGHSAINASQINFSTAYALNGGLGSITATDYGISGSQTDTFRIQGGGSAGGIQVIGTTNNIKTKGLFTFLNDPVDNTSVASVNFASGLGWYLGGVVAGASPSQGLKLDPADFSLHRIESGGNLLVYAGSGGTLQLGTPGTSVTASLATVAAGTGKGFVCIDPVSGVLYRGTGASCN